MSAYYLSFLPHLQGKEKEDKMDTSSNQPTSKQDYTSVDIEDAEFPLAAVIEKELQDLDDKSLDSCIFRVVPQLRQVNEKCYTPQIVSIGPLHHGKEELGTVEKTKLWCLQEFLDRTEKSLEDCIELVKNWDDEARSYYEERFDQLSRNEFVKMMLVDSCFIIEVMRVVESFEEPKYYVSQRNDFTAQRDMILLENQIPFFVLHGVFHFGSGYSEGKDQINEDKPTEDFIELSVKFFSNLLLTVTEEGDVERTIKNVKDHLKSGFEIKHLLDLLRICHLPTNLKKPHRKLGTYVHIPTAARLDEVGMNFKTVKNKYLVDMKYINNRGLLKIPQFKVRNDTECVLRNLIALERMSYPSDSYIMDYVFFMDSFIDTATDVDLLIQKGIIVNFVSDSTAVASLFNVLGMETTLLGRSYYFNSTSEEINKYWKDPWHKVPWRKWKETFKRDYCSTPWRIASTSAAIILLVLTLIQTICSLVSLF